MLDKSSAKSKLTVQWPNPNSNDETATHIAHHRFTSCSHAYLRRWLWSRSGVKKQIPTTIT
jgi:hypothetical protein